MEDKKKGDKKFAKAKQYITKGLFRWTEDWTAAATQFEQALKIYKQNQAHADAIKTLQMLIKCNQKNRDPWAVARNHEAMLEIYLDGKLPISDEQFIVLTRQTFIAFRMAESTDKGLKVLGRCAQYLIGKKRIDETLKILQECYQSSFQDQKLYNQGEIFNMIIDIMMNVKAYASAAEMYRTQFKKDRQAGKSHLQKFCLIIVVLSIIQQDIIRADQQNLQMMGDYPQYLNSNDCQSASNLIRFYRQSNQQAFIKETTRAAVTTIFPVSIIKRLRQIKLTVVIKQSQTGQKSTEQMNQIARKFF